MPRQDTVFDREPLYAEVWKEPVRTVAKRYGISDVALRKICQKLGVPLPPLGYWAKVAAGKKPRVTPLPASHKGQKRYVRSVWVEEPKPERDARVAALLASVRPVEWPPVIVPPTLDGCHPLIARTAKRLGTATSKPIVRTTAVDVLAVAVSPAQKDRALRILDGLVKTSIDAGATLVPHTSSESPPIHLEVAGQFVSFQIDEQLDRTLREPTRKEVEEQERYSWRKPDLRVFTPNGRLKLTVVSDNKHVPYFTVSDGAHAPLQDRLGDVLERIWSKAINDCVEQELREEERARWEKAHRRRERWETARRGRMDRVEEVEKVLREWDRAARLRRFAEELAHAEKGIRYDETVLDAKWLRRVADWLDPLSPSSAARYNMDDE